MARKYKRPARKNNQRQPLVVKIGATMGVVESRADVEVAKEAIEPDEQTQKQRHTKPKKNLCGAQKKKLKRMKLEKARNRPNLLTLPAEVRQHILHLTYHNDATRGIVEDVLNKNLCSRFKPLVDEVRRIGLSEVRHDLGHIFANKNRLRCCYHCCIAYVRIVEQEQMKLADWVSVLKRIHPSLIDDAIFVAGELAEELEHTLQNEDYKCGFTHLGRVALGRLA
ncbi:hypothetical protein FKW77_008837 [Venturia effusa]|uniref:Uncharacterized protein n=1 Tax=Venturia effusa TaxID=50376 RepID=A0A517L7X7_9PEZI|nr:hypothetical protein FKW77_008837 [Venturia effusa]